jgi:hypothetical protein
MATSSSPSTGKFVNLVYVGQIRDKNSSQIDREPAYFMVTESSAA